MTSTSVHTFLGGIFWLYFTSIILYVYAITCVIFLFALWQQALIWYRLPLTCSYLPRTRIRGMCYHAQLHMNIYSLKKEVGWRNGLAVKSTCCPYRGPVWFPASIEMGSCLPVPAVPGHLTPSSSLYGYLAHTTYIHTDTQTYKHIFLKN